MQVVYTTLSSHNSGPLLGQAWGIICLLVPPRLPLISELPVSAQKQHPGNRQGSAGRSHNGCAKKNVQTAYLKQIAMLAWIDAIPSLLAQLLGQGKCRR